MDASTLCNSKWCDWAFCCSKRYINLKWNWNIPGNVDAVKLLVESKKADVNVANDLKWTPLHFAAQNGNWIRHVQYGYFWEGHSLFSYLGRPSETDKKEPPTLQFMRSSNPFWGSWKLFYWSSLRIFYESTHRKPHPLPISPNWTHWQWRISITNKSIWISGNIDNVKLLIEHDADVDAANSFKWTPLHFAAQNGTGRMRFSQVKINRFNWLSDLYDFLFVIQEMLILWNF